jgi:hypothetical protein
MDSASLRVLDAVVALWVVLWLVLAGWTAYSVWVLADLGQTMTTAARALDSAGRGLQDLAAVPLVGDRPADLGEEVRATAAQVAGNGAAIDGQVRRLALLLGIALFFIPVTPVLGLWAPLRLARRRELRDLRRAVVRHGDDPGLRRHLANRAVHRLPYATLRTVSDDPYRDLDQGRWDRLAALELERLGLAGLRVPGTPPP